MREIAHDLFFAGVEHYDGEAIWDRLSVGMVLRLQREPTNRFDSNAIEVVVPKLGKLGYLPRTSNGALALLMDLTDCAFEATLSKKEQSENPWKRLAVDIVYVGAKRGAS